MVAEVLFTGGRPESVEIMGGAPFAATNSVLFDGSYADSALVVTEVADKVRHKLYTQSGGVLSTTTVISGETFFLHFECYGNNTSSSPGNGIIIQDSSGNPWLRIYRGGSGTYGIYYNSGTGGSPVWTLLGGLQTQVTSALLAYDLEITLGSPHTAKLYQSGSLLVNQTFTQASFTNIGIVEYNCLYRTGIGCYFSQLMATRGISTIGAKVKTIRATGAGANTGWSGTYASVNEVVNSDVNLQNAPTAGLKSSHVMGGVTVPSGFEIKAVFHWLRAKNDGTGPTNIKSLLRSSGVDYSTANLSGIGLGYAPVGARYDTDPLGSNWTASVFNAIEAGYEAAA